MNITILGTGSFGIALALACYEKKSNICMWTFSEEEEEILSQKRCYEKVLPGVLIPSDILITTDIEKAFSHADIVVVSIPAPFVKDVMQKAGPYISGEEYFVIASKGLDPSSFLPLTTVIENYVSKEQIAILSGPTFAIDLATKNPVAFTLSAHTDAENVIREAFESSFVRIQSLSSPFSISICGTLKNIFAIGFGMICGMQLSTSTQAMYFTDVLLEMRLILRLLEGDEGVIFSYAGIGDLFLTCTSEKSRNFQLGYLMGSGASSFEIQKYQSENTVEGLDALSSFYHLCREKNIDPSILSLLFKIFFLKEDKQIFYDFLTQKV